MKKEMLINVLQPEECRIAIVEDGVLEELYVERSSQESYVGNIYKGRIVNIEPSIQAAFVDFGIGRNGFLHVSDVDPAYYKHLLSKEVLAEYEAELDREYGPSESSRGDRGGRGRDRGDRGGRGRGDRGDRGSPPPQLMTAFLEPQHPPIPVPDDDEFGDFAAGVLDETTPDFAPVEPSPAPTRSTPPAHTPAVPLPPPADDETVAEFAAGLIDAEDDTDAEDFAAGVLEDDPPFAEVEVEVEVESDVTTEPVPDEVAIEDVVEAPAEEAEPKARKPRARKPRVKNEDAVDADAETESKAKGRTRRPRKKAEGEPEAADSPPDVAAPESTPPEDKPRFMGGAEHRTRRGDDDAPEIQSFFEGIPTEDFDPNAPNDRFADTGDAPSAADGRFSADDPEPAEAAEEEAREIARDDDAAEEGEAEAESLPEPVVTGRGFNDDFEDARPERGGRDRDRGERGGRGRGRGDRDRGPRGDRGGSRGDRDRDRGPRNGPGGPKTGRDRGLPKPPIQEIFKRGQEVIVQVIKEGIGTKGPTLSTYISIAGRYLVLMPSLNRVGVSRKIEDHDARRRLREIMATLNPPKGVGFIVRTAAIDRDAAELRNDLAYLLRLWQVVVKRLRRVPGPVEVYRESDMITRTIRDIFTADIDTIWVDEANAFAHASEFLQIVMPRYASRIRYFEHTEPLFHRYNIEDEIAKIHQKRIEMPLGGSLVIEQTEALVAIDVNSGNFRADNNAEETAYQMNLHAAREIARQLRLRDLGGVIVNDFIDMRSEAHRRNVEAALRNAMKRDRARTKILRISQFGLIEMTRQRIRPSLKRSIFADCPHCRGTGFVKNNESMSIEVMRMLQLAAHRSPAIQSIEVTVHTEVANYLLNRKRRAIAALEERARMEVQITGQLGVSPDTCTVRCFDANGNEVRLLPPPPLPRLSGGRTPRNTERERRYPQPLD